MACMCWTFGFSPLCGHPGGVFSSRSLRAGMSRGSLHLVLIVVPGVLVAWCCLKEQVFLWTCQAPFSIEVQHRCMQLSGSWFWANSWAAIWVASVFKVRSKVRMLHWKEWVHRDAIFVYAFWRHAPELIPNDGTEQRCMKWAHVWKFYSIVLQSSPSYVMNYSIISNVVPMRSHFLNPSSSSTPIQCSKSLINFYFSVTRLLCQHTRRLILKFQTTPGFHRDSSVSLKMSHFMWVFLLAMLSTDWVTSCDMQFERLFDLSLEVFDTISVNEVNNSCGLLFLNAGWSWNRWSLCTDAFAAYTESCKC